MVKTATKAKHYIIQQQQQQKQLETKTDFAWKQQTDTTCQMTASDPQVSYTISQHGKDAQCTQTITTVNIQPSCRPSLITDD